MDMDKRQKKYVGAWVSLIGGTIFFLGACSAIYIAFFMKAETATLILARLGRLFHNI